MSITLRCPLCRAKMTTRRSATGKPITCAKCERKFTLSDDDDEPGVVDEELPRSRKRDDHDIGLPRNRRARGGKRRKKKRVDAVRFILPLAGLAFLFVIGLVVYLFVFRPGSKDADGNRGIAATELPETDLLAWAPGDSSDVSYINHRALAYLQTSGWNPYKQPVLVPSGLDLNDVDAAMLAGRAGRPDGVFVLRLKTPNPEGIDQAMARQGGRPVQLGTQTIYRTQHYTMYRASDRVLVVSDRRDYIEGRIGSNSNRVEIGGQVLEYVRRASADAWTAQVAVGRWRIIGFQAQSALITLQIREEGALVTSDITYINEETASQAAQANSTVRGLEIQRTGARVIYRHPGGFAAGGLGLGIVEWRHWRW